MKEIRRVTEVKKGNKWEVTYIEVDELLIYKALTDDLIAKKINACKYIKSIKRMTNYDGTQNIIVNYDNGCRSTYTVKSN